MSDTPADTQSELRKQLSSVTRHGLFSETARERGFDLPVAGGGSEHVDPDEVSRRIAAFSDDDIEAHIAELVVRPVASLALTRNGLLKLQATLLLGARPAEVYSSDARRDAVMRTYLRPRRSDGQLRPEHERYRDDPNTEGLTRSERDDLLDRIVWALESGTEGREPDAYSTVVYEVRHVEPRDTNEPVVESFRRRIRANRDGVSEFRQIFTYAVYGSAAPTAFNLGPGDLTFEHVRELQTSHITGTRYECVIRFQPLAKGQTIELVWVTTSKVDPTYFEPGTRLRAFGVTPRGDIPTATVFVKFARDRLPFEVWKLSGTPADGIDFVNDNDEGVPTAPELFQEWKGLQAGRAYVFRWRWNPRKDISE